MIDKNLLLGRMVAAGENQGTLSKKLGISKSTFSRLVNNKGCFDLEQAKRLCELLNITDNVEKVQIFLAKTS